MNKKRNEKMGSETNCGFEKAVNEYLATHPVKGLADWGDFQKFAATAPVKGAVDATVYPCHKARRIRFWGALEHLPLMRSWGLDVDEFDPDAAARGCVPDVIICHLEPTYSQGSVEQILGAVRRGTHFITLQNTDLWCKALAKRLGHTYSGVLNVSAKDAVYFANCPRLLAGFPEGRLDAGAYPILRAHACAVYMTGERCLLGIADMKQKRIASAIAQYPYGKGAATFVCPYANKKNEEYNDPAYKRLLLNLISLLPPVGGAKCGTNC